MEKKHWIAVGVVAAVWLLYRPRLAGAAPAVYPNGVPMPAPAPDAAELAANPSARTGRAAF